MNMSAHNVPGGHDLILLRALAGQDVGLHITATLKVRCWRAPARWIRSVGNNVGRNGVTSEEPDTDVGGGPFHGVYATSILVEVGAI